jgi:hypothetical protein
MHVRLVKVSIAKSAAPCYSMDMVEVLHLPIGKNKTRLSVTLDIDTAHYIEDLAKNEDRTVSSMIAVLIKESLGNRKKVHHGFVRGAEYYKTATNSVDDKDETQDKEP